jgi:hypothetical protein
MFVLTRSITILDEHTPLTRLEIDASLLAALGTAHADLVHPQDNDSTTMVGSLPQLSNTIFGRVRMRPFFSFFIYVGR